MIKFLISKLLLYCALGLFCYALMTLWDRSDTIPNVFEVAKEPQIEREDVFDFCILIVSLVCFVFSSELNDV